MEVTMATTEGTSTPETRRECVACRSDIPLLATRCSVCSADQRTWVRRLQLLGALGAGITLVASGITYVISTGGRMLNESRPPRVGLVSFSLLGERTFGNFGPKGVYLSHLQASGEVREDDTPDALKVYWDHRVVPINMSLAPGAFETLRAPSGAKAGLSPVLEFDAKAWRLKLQQSRMAETCLEGTYYSSSDPTLVLMKENFGEALRTFDAAGELVFASGGGAPRKQQVPLTGVFLRRHSELCDQWLGKPQRNFTPDEW